MRLIHWKTGKPSAFWRCNGAWNIQVRDMKGRQKHVYATGEALKRHCRSAHQGNTDLSCPACNELIKKQGDLNVKAQQP